MRESTVAYAKAVKALNTAANALSSAGLFCEDLNEIIRLRDRMKLRAEVTADVDRPNTDKAIQRALGRDL